MKLMITMPENDAILPLASFVECTIERRLNRFVVEVKRGERKQVAHINNTGRLTELLVQGRKGACLEKSGGSTDYRLFAVRDGDAWALIDTQFQTRAFEAALAKRKIPWLHGHRLLRRSPRLDESVLDYLLQKDDQKEELYLETKSAVLRKGLYAMYPDCPTLRGQRHIRTLTEHARNGGRSAILFIAALTGVPFFKPYREGDPEVAVLLKEAAAAQVTIKAISMHFEPGKGVLLDSADLPVELD